MTDAANYAQPPADRMVSFVDALKLFFTNFAKFSGRSSRGAFWWWVVWSLGLSILFGVLDGALFNIGVPVMGGIFFLITLLPGIAVGVRRLHDIGRTGWWLLIGFVPIIGFLLLIFWYAQPGQRAPNAFGPDREAGR